MGEATGLRNNALPYPVYGAPFGVVVPILDADGDLVVGAAGLDSEVSLNGDTFADCTNEATQIATDSGMYYLLLTGTELTCDVAAVIVKTSTSGAKTTPVVLYPRKLVTLASGTAGGGDTAYITLAAGTITYDDQYNGCLCIATIDGNVEARVINDCTSADQHATVTPAWNVAVDDSDTYVIKLPEGMQVPTANMIRVTGTAQTARDIGASVLLSSGSGAGQLDFTSGVVKANLTQILGTVLTETAGLLAAAFKKFFNVATPTGTVNSLPDAVPGAAGGVFIAGTNAATTVTTALTTTFTGNLTGSVASVTGAVGGNVSGNVTGSVGSLAVQAKADVNAEVVDVLRTDTLPDSYAADGDQPTIAQAILAIEQYLFERSVSGTTVTVKKPNGSTTAMTFTLNDGTTPTSITRAS